MYKKSRGKNNPRPHDAGFFHPNSIGLVKSTIMLNKIWKHFFYYIYKVNISFLGGIFKRKKRKKYPRPHDENTSQR